MRFSQASRPEAIAVFVFMMYILIQFVNDVSCFLCERGILFQVIDRLLNEGVARENWQYLLPDKSLIENCRGRS